MKLRTLPQDTYPNITPLKTPLKTSYIMEKIIENQNYKLYMCNIHCIHGINGIHVIRRKTDQCLKKQPKLYSDTIHTTEKHT